jgi:hypothetical protein
MHVLSLAAAAVLFVESMIRIYSGRADPNQMHHLTIGMPPNNKQQLEVLDNTLCKGCHVSADTLR